METNYAVCISTEFGLRREYTVYFKSQQDAEAWLSGHNFAYSPENWTGDSFCRYLDIELQFTDPGYRTFFGAF